MKRKNMTRNALVTSILALLLCVSMLVGTTFAWFTDEVTSGRNQIVSGNLDVVLEYKNNWNDDWQVVDSETAIFNEDALYEPGYTEVVFLRVSNAGNLALKYNLTVGIYEEAPSTNVAGEEFWLSDHLQVGTYIQDEYSSGFNYADILIPAMFGSREAALGSVTLGKLADYEDSLALANSSPLLPGEETAQVVALVLTMPETVGNEANHMTGVAAPWVALGVNLVATQYTHEEDSFDNKYDADADYTQPAERNLITNLLELREAADTGGEYYLGKNIPIGAGEKTVAVNNDFVLYLDGYSIDASEMAGRPFELADDVDFTINGKVSNDYTDSIESQEAVLVGTYGLINIPAGNDATVTLNGGKYVGATDDGSFIKPRGTGKISIALNDVVSVDKSTNGSGTVLANGYSGTDFELTVNGGYYEAPLPFDVPSINIKNATIVSTGKTNKFAAIGIQHPNKSANPGALIENCTIEAGYAGISVSNGMEVEVKNSTITAPTTGYAMLIRTSGGKITATNTTYIGQAGTTGPVDAPALIYIDGELEYEKQPR